MNMYYIAIVLPAHLDKKILKHKQHMLEKYECRVGLKSPAHITIIPPFWMHPDKESSLLADMELLAGKLRPFPLATQDFGAFKPRTIFVAVRESLPLQEVKKAADRFFGARPQYGIKLESRPFHPHITIATRDLHKGAFAEAWPVFAEKEFREEWEAEGLSVLRHNKKNWDVIQTSQFQAI